jgi:protein gp37
VGERRRVFTGSMCDIFDNRAPEAWRADLWRLIAATPDLTWMLLTKRPQNIAGMLPADWGAGWRNVWLGCTAENQAEAARRIPALLEIPAAAVRFLSIEPMLEAVDLGRWLGPGKISWVIGGGESGVGLRSRPMRPEWLRALLDQCRTHDVAAFVKQLGSNRAAWPGVAGPGADPAQWPHHLRVREFPA